MAKNPKSKLLRFAVGGLLLGAPLVTACGADEVNRPEPNEPAPEESGEIEAPINMPLEDEPVAEPEAEAERPPTVNNPPTPTEGE